MYETFVIAGYQSFYRKTMYPLLVILGYLYLYCLTLYQNFVNTGHQYVQWWTHVMKGLHQNDFIRAAKMDKLDASG
jgi:hypothetical protein